MNVKLFAATAAAVILMNAANAIDPAAERSRRVKVALALAEKETAAQGKPKCHDRCGGDLALCRAESLATGKPLFVFVGGCQGLTQALPDDALTARATSYTADQASEPTKPRVVILSRGTGQQGTGVDKDSLYIRSVLPITTTPEKVRQAGLEAEDAAKPEGGGKTKKLIDWFV